MCWLFWVVIRVLAKPCGASAGVDADPAVPTSRPQGAEKKLARRPQRVEGPRAQGDTEELREHAGAWFLADAEAAAEDRAQKSRKKGGLAVELLRLQCSRCFRITPTLPPLCLQGFDTASRIHGLAVATGCQPNAIVDGVVAACRLNEYVVAS